MKQSKLTPFDAETILMIKSVTGYEPEICEKEELFEIKMYVPDKDKYGVRLAINAVIGRLGTRIEEITYIRDGIFIKGAIFFVKYDDCSESLPDEMRTDLQEPNEKSGLLYCHKLMEIRAVKVSRDNLQRLIDFTGGGTINIPRTPDGIAIYSFPTENGVMLDVPESWYVIRFPDGRFSRMEKKEFEANYEPKDGPNYTTESIINKFDMLFTRNLDLRLRKLTEEYNELIASAENYRNTGTLTDTDKENIVDELADVNAVLFHIASLFGLSQRELLDMAVDKIKGRLSNPNYKRKHAHDDGECCDNYKHFEQRFNTIK